ncbi:PREDICTED: uncharacterized protein LOC107064960 isoform X2 [Polistes dominula]|nr:PREDICTED: uncharacterized protein LOC107064960 isoform X2 [Polistes dominula]XP_015173662.1 PREDICTED: uncharacterized protein LOC107064960 isoform X2 [Polistes dominula]XP_015173663.1 PREDICTED: uncharacterized protein LOC107064960 isoform X2 [Polistes dominula]XP_015173664.1 PREDICTED: uncharacterized protein LOC107064960 isoform X2 [Polistes dominula]XP_015173665.1 PREDICTED: uncharacterized protein LOC107064960 isoform X2 [Polistes dominula]XP_015173666.1 PREDICTED: uncharacterized pro
MGIDSMRVGGGRCSPLLVGGLLIACLMLLCNWWTLSSENLDLVHQIDELGEQLKISAEENDQCITLRNKLEQRYRHAEDEVAYLHVSLEKQNEFNKRQKENFETSIALCKREFDSNKINEKEKENEKLQEELDRVKDEMEKLKLAYNAPVDNIRSDPTLTPTRKVIDGSQLRLVRDSAIRISVAGQRGLKYHQIPILPSDPPGAVRLAPRLSVTMLKAERNSKLESSTIEGMRNDKTEKIDISNEGKKAAETMSYVEKRNNQLSN